ncbi:hypothetical protein VPH35_110982 [Triticum aestivum]
MIICEEYVFNSMYVNLRVKRSMSTKSRTLSISGTGFLSIKKKIISDFISIRTKWIHHLLPMSKNITNLPLIPRASMKKRVKQGWIHMFHLSKPLMPCISQPGVYSRPRSLA